MPYCEDKHLRVTIRPSPSLLFNNLCVHGRGLAYIHTRSGAALQTIPNQEQAKTEVNRIDTQDYSLVQTVQSCTVDGSCLLVLGNEAGLQVWDDTGVNLLYVWKLPKTQEAPSCHTDFVRGVAFNISATGAVQLCAGCSSGAIQVFSVTFGPLFKPTLTLQQHKSSIVALGSSFQSRRGGWSTDLTSELVSCDIQGTICVWEATSGDEYKCVRTIEGGVPCCSLAVRKGFIIAARTDGCIRIYGLNDGRLRGEIVAHSRWLSAMDIHPEKDMVATVAQDCTLGVWALPIAGAKAACLLSVCKYNELMTGVTFCGVDNDDVAAVSYDLEVLTIWKPL